nr:HepT-like ribonuclease domain-containing protein [uncultured Friedmanniella sp.]
MTTSVRKARDAAERVVAVCDVLAGLVPSDVDAFAADVRTQWAVEMGLIRIGEAVNRIPDEVLTLFSEQPWRQIVAMRNFAAHQYDDLDPRRVWRTVTRDVPHLRAYLVDTVLPGLDR